MPNVSQTATSLVLTNTSLAYKNEQAMYIHEQIAPAVPVIKQTAKIYSYGADNLRIVNTIRSKGGKSNGIDWSVSKASVYDLEDHALHDYIAEEDYENEEKPIDAKIDTTETLTDVLMIAKEYALAQSLQSTSIMTNNTTLTGTDQWNDYDNSDPIGDITTGIEAVYDATGKVPNTIIIARDSWIKLLYHPKIKDMFPGASAITADILMKGIGRIFPDITKVLVGNVQYNNSNKGGSLSLARVWSKTCLVAFIEPTPKKKSQTLAYTFQHKKPRTVDFISQSSGDVDLKKRKSDFVQVSDKYDQVLINVNCAYLLKSCIA